MMMAGYKNYKQSGQTSVKVITNKLARFGMANIQMLEGHAAEEFEPWWDACSLAIDVMGLKTEAQKIGFLVYMCANGWCEFSYVNLLCDFLCEFVV